jgi:hypothetical protein
MHSKLVGQIVKNKSLYVKNKSGRAVYPRWLICEDAKESLFDQRG